MKIFCFIVWPIIVFVLCANANASDNSKLTPYLLRKGSANTEKLQEVLRDRNVVVGDLINGALEVKIDSYTRNVLLRMGVELIPTYDWSLMPPDVDPSLFLSVDEIKSEFESISFEYDNFVEFEELGRSVEGVSIFGLRMFAGDADSDPDVEFRILGCHHGNELMSAEVVYRIAKYFAINYQNDIDIKTILNSASILFVPVVNPDGRNNLVRENAAEIDLNRNYGYHWIYQSTSGEFPFSEPETQAIAKDHFLHSYSLSLSFHTFGDIINYVWNYSPNPSPDDSAIESLSYVYQNYTNYSVTRGFDWYKTNGDTNDFSYGISGDFDWTIEVANEDIDHVFEINLQAVKSMFLNVINSGLHLYVKNSETGKPINGALIRFDTDQMSQPSSWIGYTAVSGKFYRLISPMNANLFVWYAGFEPKEVSISLDDIDSVIDLDVSLVPKQDYTNIEFAWKLISVLSDDSNIGYPFYVLGPMDGKSYKLFRDGEIVVALSSECYLYDGDDLAIVSSDENRSSADIFVSSNPFDDFVFIKRINGSATIDVQDDLNSFSYVKIKDSGDSMDGFVVDAISCMHSHEFVDEDTEVDGDEESFDVENDSYFEQDEELSDSYENSDRLHEEYEPDFDEEFIEKESDVDIFADESSCDHRYKKVHASGCQSGMFGINFGLFLMLILIVRSRRHRYE